MRSPVSGRRDGESGLPGLRSWQAEEPSVSIDELTLERIVDVLDLGSVAEIDERPGSRRGLARSGRGLATGRPGRSRARGRRNRDASDLLVLPVEAIVDPVEAELSAALDRRWPADGAAARR